MKIVTILLTTFIVFSTSAQQKYWQQEVNYIINVTLDNKGNFLHGNEEITYINHSPDTLAFIWFHLWPNAYKNNETALAIQSDLYIRSDNAGWLDSLSFSANGTAMKTIPHETYIDVIKLVLDKPLAPGSKIAIQTNFRIKIPPYKSRMGYTNNCFYISQWYPKPAVYDLKGWHPMPYLNIGEFYSEYGSYTVNITVPSDYVVASSGELKTENELTRYKLLGTKNMNGELQKYSSVTTSPAKTLSFQQTGIHDFAWFASPDFIIRYNPFTVSPNKKMDVFTYSLTKESPFWPKANEKVGNIILKMNEMVGDYPYNTVSAVEGNRSAFGGGMEYPKICIINQPDDYVLVHEIVHNWFYGIIGNNERSHAWMDEGITEYFTSKITSVQFISKSGYSSFIIDQESEKFPDEFSYTSSVYAKASVWLRKLKKEMGREVFDAAIKNYYKTWKFRHPYPEDFKRIMEKHAKKDLTAIFQLLYTKDDF